MSAFSRLTRRIPLVAAVNIVIGISGMGFQVVLSRYLDPNVFGSYVAILALIYMFSQVMESYSLTIAREQTLNHRTVSASFAAGFAAILGVVCAAAFVGLGSAAIVGACTWPMLVAASTVLVSFSILWFLRGIAQGVALEKDYVASRGVEMIGRLVLGIGLLAIVPSLPLAILASAAGAVLATLHLAIRLARCGKLNWRVEPQSSSWQHTREAARMFGTWIPLAIFIRLDTILAPRVLLPGDVGAYGVLSTVGKAILLYSLVMSPLIFPYAVRSQEKKEWVTLLGGGAALSTGLMVVTSGLFLLAGPDLVTSLFGRQYEAAAGWMPAYLLALAPLAVHANVINLQMARGKGLSLRILWSGLAVYTLVLVMAPSTLTGYMLWIAVAHLVLSCVGWAGLRLEQSSINLASLGPDLESRVRLGYGTGGGANGIDRDRATAQIERQRTPIS